uniref:PET hydrolase/cutinase-like domain-containing protein n=1 Tax=Alexandrium catenella TaxID=2925 RepID=A0A7S1PPU2_ALECA|mmetsp:Transcript_105235/g.280148  ORF Transcript_105235/g.280148 Transcript_105235/m.280148 type:complete len:426 (+) Transcript_105235:26-1303(+)
MAAMGRAGLLGLLASAACLACARAERCEGAARADGACEATAASSLGFTSAEEGESVAGSLMTQIMTRKQLERSAREAREEGKAAPPEGSIDGKRPLPHPDASELAALRRAVKEALVQSAAEGDPLEGFPGIPDQESKEPIADEGNLGQVTGQVKVTVETDIAIEGFSGCPGPNKGNIYLPAKAEGKVPIIMFAHAFGAGGAAVDETHRNDLFIPLAKMGFAVVAHQTGGQLDYCDSSHDQTHMYNWAKNSTYAARIDFGRSILMGSSMGGRASLKNAADAHAVEKYGVVSAIVVNAHCTFGCGVPIVPVHFVAGRRDGIAHWQATKKVFESTHKNKTFGLLPRLSHIPSTREWTKLVTPRFQAFARCDMFGHADACKNAFDADFECTYSCAYCDCSSDADRTQKCKNCDDSCSCESCSRCTEHLM